MANDIVLVILKVVKKQNTEHVSLFLMQSKLMFMVIYSFDHKE